MIPLYGFLEGDTIGLLVLAERTDTMEVLAAKLRQAASVRVADNPKKRIVLFQGRPLDSLVTVAGAGLTPLDRIDVVEERR